jgi:rhodanese-related sulfurtransferase
MVEGIRKGAAVFLLGFLLTGITPGTVSAKEFEYISLERLRQLVERGDQSILVVDTQPQRVYEMGHIKGAVNLPWAMDLQTPGNLPKDKILILYCDCQEEEDSIDMARQLKEKWNYERIKLLKGGWSRWKGLGYPVDK